MHKQKVWIFGDSFGDPDYNTASNYSWVKELATLYDVTNFAHRGVGADWVIKQLCDATVNKDLSDTILIVLMPSVVRLNLSFYKQPSDQVYTTMIALPKNQDQLELIQPYIKHKEFVESMFTYYVDRDFTNRELMKSIGIIKLYSSLFKKTLVWNIDDDLPDNLATIVVNTDNFYYVNCGLYSISKQEGIIVKHGTDYRANHLSYDNHVIMLQELTNWINNGTQITLSNFRRDIQSVGT